MIPLRAFASTIPNLATPTTRHTAYVVPVLGQWVVYAPGHGVAALVNESAARALRRGDRSQDARALEPLLEVFRQPARFPEPIGGEICPSFLGILPTRGCNLACVYCNFGGPTADKVFMKPEVAVASVDWMAERLVASGRRDFRIHFFGGEPFIAPDIVDVVVHRARWLAAKHALSLFIDASSNGVFNEGRCEFIGDYFGGILLSFDGPAEFHDRNRPAFEGKPSFEIVNQTAKRLSTLPIELSLRVCITEDSVGEMSNITRWMAESFKPAVINFETLTPGVLAERAGLRVPDPYRFAKNYVAASRLADSMGVRTVYSASAIERTRLSFCPVGTDAVIVAPDGRASACYLMPEDWQNRGLDMDLGRVHEDGRVVLDPAAVARTRMLPMQKPRCERCLCQWTCGGGCHVNQTYPGCGNDYTDFCIQTRLVTTCALLRDLQADDLVDRLLEDCSAMDRLALHDWDPIDVSGLIGRDIGRLSTPSHTNTAPVGTFDRPRSLVADGLTLLG